MWRKAILTAVLLLVLNAPESRSQYSGEITLDPVIGQVGPGTIGIGQIVMPLRAAYSGPSGTYAIMSNSFMLYSLDPGSISAIEGERLKIWTDLFTGAYQGERVRLSSEVNWFQQPIPTPPFDITTPNEVAGIWFAGVHNYGLGMPDGYSEVVWNIKFVTSAADVGNVICLDTAKPAIQAWEWAGSGNSWFPVFNNGDGPYCFTVVPPPPQPIQIDIKPDGCPNPLNFKDNGASGKGKAVLAVAVMGTASFDVNHIDPTTVKLEGVPLVKWTVEDVGTPETAPPCACNTLGPDGHMDLSVKFYRDAIIQAINDAYGPVYTDDEIPLTLTGKLKALYGGTSIEGIDCVLIKGKDLVIKNSLSAGNLALPLVYRISNYPNPFNPTVQISFSLSKAARVTLVVFNTTGQQVAALVDEQKDAGEHTVTWNGSDFASGVYFYRLTAGDFAETKKMVLLK